MKALLDVLVGKCADYFHHLVYNKNMSDIVTKEDFVEYITANPVATLGTINENGTPLGTIVYVTCINTEKLYFVTKNETLKYRNIQKNNSVSVTIVNTDENSTLQAGGAAKTIDDGEIISAVMADMARIYGKSADYLPPIAKIRAGVYEVVEINLSVLRLANFKGARAGDPDIFKEK